MPDDPFQLIPAEVAGLLLGLLFVYVLMFRDFF